MWVWQAFNELQTCRPIGMSVGPIPWVAIDAYARAKDIAETERFERLIRALDSEFLKHRRESEDDA